MDLSESSACGSSGFPGFQPVTVQKLLKSDALTYLSQLPYPAKSYAEYLSKTKLTLTPNNPSTTAS